MEIDELLARMSAEHERHSAAIAALEDRAVKQQARIAQQLDPLDPADGNDKLYSAATAHEAAHAMWSAPQADEVCGHTPVCSRAPSSHAPFHSLCKICPRSLQLLVGEEAALNAELPMIEAEHALLEAERTALRFDGAMTHAYASTRAYNLEPPCRELSMWRKRCRGGYSNMLALACTLSALELDADPPADVPHKRGRGAVHPAERSWGAHSVGNLGNQGLAAC